ncbi:putative RING-H2 finger protein ATL19 [Mercurialis annua]|uniref:putative RING-H2 finger protein ATL19 n=1 Tax=Mercurialis annua TaxID=3986 RepID=UPI00215E1B90|nr:putative RING-H2 finger protein ATL19 [Mercurialis annua]
MMIHPFFSFIVSKNFFHPSVLLLTGSIIIIVFCVTMLFILATSTIFLAFYLTFKRIIQPIFISHTLDRDLEMFYGSRFSFQEDLESMGEIFNEYPCVVKDKKAHTQSIDKLFPSIKFDENEMRSKYEDCSICLEDYKNGEACRIFPLCNHIFHLKCIDIWLENNLTCPICRKTILDV